MHEEERARLEARSRDRATPVKVADRRREMMTKGYIDVVFCRPHVAFCHHLGAENDDK
jgi:hypothetical protein